MTLIYSRRLLALVWLFSLSWLSGCQSGPADAAKANADTSKLPFTLAVIPDTQKYSRYSPERFSAQTRWIADNYAKQNIRFSMHLGDVVDLPHHDSEWQAARQALAILEQNPATPYSVLAGNHDLMAYVQGGINDNQDRMRHGAEEPFIQYFSPQRLAKKDATLAGYDTTGFNRYHLFEANNQHFMVMALDWRVSEQTLAWAQQALDAHPDVPVILTTHQLLNVDADGQAFFTGHGAYLWDKLIKDNDQIFMTFNGHHHGEAVKRAKNSYGREVVMVLVDYQSNFWGGNGMLQLVEFDFAGQALNFRSFSPWVAAIPAAERQAHDELSRWEFSIAMDLEARFSQFNQSTLGRYSGNIDGTLGYWIFDDAHQLTAANGEMLFADLSGRGQHMALASLNTAKSQQSDWIEQTGETPPFGHAAGALRFKGDGEKGQDKGVFLKAESALDDASSTLAEFTLEAIVRFPSQWHADKHSWSGIFAQQASHQQVCEFHQLACKGSDSAMVLAASSLMELQWVSLSPNLASRSNWSWSLNKQQWYHVAVVNDGKYNSLYVNGARVMRTAEIEQPGALLMPGKDWLVGISSSKGEYANPFYGDIAEIRLTGRALKPAQWLMAN